jgi:hypothetical protein
VFLYEKCSDFDFFSSKNPVHFFHCLFDIDIDQKTEFTNNILYAYFQNRNWMNNAFVHFIFLKGKKPGCMGRG